MRIQTFHVRASGGKYDESSIDKQVVVAAHIATYHFNTYSGKLEITLIGGACLYAVPETYVRASCGVRALLNYFEDVETMRDVDRWCDWLKEREEAAKANPPKSFLRRIFG